MTRATHYLQGRARFAIFSLILAGVFVGAAHADTIVRGFKATGSLAPGWVVTVDKKAVNTVKAAPAADSSQMYGVVIDPSQAPVTVNQQGQQIFVANSGAYPTLVSLSGGTISPGDYISMSHTDGVAAKADSKQSYILGRALEKFDGKSGVITAGADGLPIGRIVVNVVPGLNPLVKNEVIVPSFLKKFAEGLTGKQVTAVRIYAAVGVFVICAIVAFGVLWVGIRSGMIAIGRNPLSKQSIMRSLLEVIVVAVLVLIAGAFGVYLLLKL